MVSPSSPLVPPQRRAFSLVELLVTIGIIAALASLLLPAVSRWRKAGATVACTRNLQQIHYFLTSYAQDHNGDYPAVSDATTGNSWWLTLQNYIALPDQVVDYNKKTIFLCPSAIDTYPRNRARRTYGMNIEGISDWRTPIRVTKQRNLSQTILVTDTKNATATEADGYQYFRWDTSTRYLDAVDARHSQRANSLFLDGHVEPIRPSDATTPTLIKNMSQ